MTTSHDKALIAELAQMYADHLDEAHRALQFGGYVPLEDDFQVEIPLRILRIASELHTPIEAGNGGDGSRVRGWFVKDYADGWIYFDNEEDAKLQVDATGAMMLVGFAPYDPIVKSAAEQFAKWLDDGPKLAKAAGCYVGIKVTNLPAPPSPSNEGEKP